MPKGVASKASRSNVEVGAEKLDTKCDECERYETNIIIIAMSHNPEVMESESQGHLLHDV